MNAAVSRLKLAATVGIVCAISAWAHEDHDHSGASLARPQSATLGAPIHLSKATQFLMDVRTAPVVQETLPRRLKTLGRIVLPPGNRAEVRAPFQGLIVYGDDAKIPEPGAWVEAGAVLAQLEQTIEAPQRVSLAAEVASTQTDLELAREELGHAALELERVRALGDAASQRRLMEARAAHTHAAVRVQGLERKLAELRAAQSTPTETNPQRVSLRAPISGLIASADAVPGEFVGPERLLFEIVNPDVVWAVADVYEQDLPFVERAAKAIVQTESYEAQFEAKVHHVSARLDAETRTVDAAFAVPNPNHRLRDGMFVTVYIETGGKLTGAMVPKESVVEQDGVTVAYVKTGPETFAMQEVQVAGTWGDRQMIEAGLSPDDVVVTQGIYQVRAAAAATGTAQPQEETSLEHGHEH